jgi:hypothetical protein
VEEAGGASADSNSSDGGSFTLSSEQWSCGIVERTTATVKPKEKFTLYVTFRNLGTWSWTSNTIDFVYRNGFRHEGTRIQDLRSTIAPGGTVTIAINYKAPKGGGSYQSFFDLQVGNHTFCGVKVTFEVIEK